ncbi:MAG: hypothetical protein ACOCUS_04755 [Polyangiales bacterium]
MRIHRAVVLVYVAILGCSLLTAAPARAQDGDTRVCVRSFGGPNAEMVRRAVVRVLGARGELSLVPHADVEATTDRLGTAEDDAEGWVEVAREHELDALVEGRVQRRGRGWRTVVRVREGRSGEVVATLERAHRSGRAMVRRIQRATWSALGEDLVAARRPAPAEPETEPASEEQSPRTSQRIDEAAADAESADETSAPDDSAEGDARALHVSLGLELFTRELRFTDDLLGELPDYELSAAPALDVGLAWYPGAHFTDGIGASFGLTARWSRGFAIQSVSNQGSGPGRDTYRRIVELGLRWQHAFGPVAPTLAVAYGAHEFRIEPPPAGPRGSERDDVPFAKYLYVRIAGGAAVDVGPLVVDVELAWLHLLEMGQLDDARWFPRADGAGGEAVLGVGYHHDSGLGVRLSGRFRRYFFSMHPEPGDPRVAGGAVDQSFAGAVELQWRL